MPKGIKGFQKGHPRFTTYSFPKGNIPWNKGYGEYFMGNKNPRFGKTHTKEACEKIRQANLGKKLSEEHKRKIGSSQKGKVISPETRRKIKESRKGYKPTRETIEKMRLSKKGKRCSIKTEFKKGLIPWNFKGLCNLKDKIRHLSEYKEWRKAIYKRDNYTCLKCGVWGNRLNVHHVESFSSLLQEFLSAYSQFSPIEDKETLARLAITYKPFWDLDNGITLCKICHGKCFKFQ